MAETLLIYYVKSKKALEAAPGLMDNPETQYTGAELMAMYGYKPGFDIMMSYLNAGELTHRSIPVLGKLKDKRAIKPLLQLLVNPDPEIRIASIRGLSYFEDQTVVEGLTKAYEREKSLDVIRVINKVLFSLTHNYPDNLENKKRWTEWWEENKAEYLERWSKIKEKNKREEE